MARNRKNDLVTCRFFTWRLGCRKGVWYADGRSNSKDVGRHSLGTRDRQQALHLVGDLDRAIAVKHGLIVGDITTSRNQKLSLEDGRKLYEEHLQRPLVARGTKKSTQKKYRATLDKFIPFVRSHGIDSWNDITKKTVNAYLTHLDQENYAGTTMQKEAVTIAQIHKWLRAEGNLGDIPPLGLEIDKVEGQRSYCYTKQEVQAILDHCRVTPSVSWLLAPLVGLACTGLRIAELCSLRWSDLDFRTGMLQLSDETGRARTIRLVGKARQLKSGRSRQLPLHPELVAVLSKVVRKDGHVFHGPRGGRLKPDTVRNVLVKRVIKPLSPRFPSAEDEQGFKDGRLHSFRHFFASQCAIRGVPERIVMEWRGHADSDMVRHYFHLHDEESRRQMDRLDPLGNNAGDRPPGNDTGAEKQPGEEASSPDQKQDPGENEKE